MSSYQIAVGTFFQACSQLWPLDKISACVIGIVVSMVTVTADELFVERFSLVDEVDPQDATTNIKKQTLIVLSSS
jgi:hypothetical protein